MIVFDESEHLESDFTDITLAWIQELYGPQVKDMLLIPKVVVMNVFNHGKS